MKYSIEGLSSYRPTKQLIEIGYEYAVNQNPFPIEKIPPYPTYELAKAKGGEKTYKIREIITGKFISEPCLAEEGETLRDADLKYQIDFSENLLYRAKVLQNCENNERYQALQIELCSSSVLYWINTFCWTYDPRRTPDHKPSIPMVTFKFQDELITFLIWLIKTKQSGQCEKSRDMGLTWINALVIAYCSIFAPGFVSYYFALNEETVDDRTVDSFFGKIRFILNHLPPWMRKGWIENSKDDLKMKIKFPENNSVITGELTGGTAGRSGRGKFICADEFAFVEQAKAVLDAINAIGDSILFGSTVNGKGNPFYEMSIDPLTLKMTMHWSRHPLKNSWWALREKSKPSVSEESWAQEHDINYERSTKNRVFKTFTSISSDQGWCHIQEGKYFDYDPDLDVWVGMDLGFGDGTSVVFAQIKEPLEMYKPFTDIMLVFFDEEEAREMNPTEWSNKIWEKGYCYHWPLIADMRTGGNRDWHGKKLQNYYRDNGIWIDGDRTSEAEPIIEMELWLNTPGRIAVNKHGCPNLIKGFESWGYPVDNRTGEIKYDASPRHDQFSHRMKATVYLINWMKSAYSLKKIDESKDFDWDFSRKLPGKMI